MATFYDGSIAVLDKIIKTMIHILHEGEKLPNADSLLTARLHEDMYPLTDQVRLVAQWSEYLAARLSGREAVKFEAPLTTFPELFERLETGLKSVAEADKDTVNSNRDVSALTPVGPGVEIPMTGAAYAHNVVLPNVYFHLNTAYGILRKEGVQIGKRDYYVGFFGPK